MKTLALKIQYDGTNYHGWQTQKNALTIQDNIESALENITGVRIPIIAAGRTDSGVHARGQVISFELDENFNLPLNRLVNAINSKLPFDIRLVDYKAFDDKFHARFDAIAREYEYYLSTQYNLFDRYYTSYIKFPLNIDKLIETGNFFIRKDDFTTFSKFNPDNNNPVCDITECKWEKVTSTKFKLTIKSNHFLYGMVRSIVGTMIDFSREKRDFDDIEKSLLAKNRQLNSPLAPAMGLFLNRVYYPDKFNF